MTNFSFFTPTTKVHKQRNIMRATDLRLARYTRRGILLSFSIFCVAMLLGDFFKQNTTLAIVMGLGILLTTIIRAYFLFRFDATYGAAPGRWRNLFFITSLIGACWWGMMLAVVSYKLKMQAEATLLWVYNVSFFSCVSHVFSPYIRFYVMYMALCLLPSCLAAFLTFTPFGAIYGLMLLTAFYFLQRQGRELGNDYWKRLQSNYDLTQRANALKAETISTQSSMSTKETLFSNLSKELKLSLQEIIGSLILLKSADLPEQETDLLIVAEQKSQQQLQILQNVSDYSKISSKEVVLEEDVLDLRQVLEKAVVTISGYVYQKNIEIYTQYSEDFPLRVKGDAKRIKQILTNLATSAVSFASEGSMVIDIHYRQLSDATGKLSVNVFVDNPKRSPEIEQELFDAFKPQYASDMSLGLNLAIAKGLASCMKGTVGANYTETNQLRFWFTIEMPIVTLGSSNNQYMSKLNGKHLLLYRPPAVVEKEYQKTLESWGLTVLVIHNFAAALALIDSVEEGEKKLDAVLICTELQDISPIELCRKLVGTASTHRIPQLITVTQEQSKMPAIESLFSEQANIHLIDKPVEYKQLRHLMKKLLTTEHEGLEGSDESDTLLKGKNILLLQQSKMDNTITRVLLEKLGCQVASVMKPEKALSHLKERPFDAFIVETAIEGLDMSDFTKTACELNQGLHSNGYKLPILGLNSHHRPDKEKDQAQCLQYGMDYFIETPLEIDDVQAILRRWIARANHMAESKVTTGADS